MKLLLVDLDDTLLDTAAIKNAFFNKLATVYDIDLNTVVSVYEEYKNKLDTDDWIYDFTMAFDQDIWFSTKDLGRLGLPFNTISGTLDIVKSFSGAKMIFTYGNERLQNFKIDALGMRNVFNNIIITPQSKYDMLASWVTDNHLIIDKQVFDEVVIIDDNEEFLERVRKSFPWIQTIPVNQKKTQ